MNISQLGEFGLIEALQKYTPVSKDVIKGIGDDAAVLPYTAKEYLLFTTDMMAEDVHFNRRMAPEAIGHKALASNISDIAAMGGWPTHAVVSIGLPKGLKAQWIKDVYKGMESIAKHFNVSIVGGDTIKSHKIVINIALLGRVEKKCLVTRSGAKSGDSIFVTGCLGDSLKSGHHLNFFPRLEQARFLVKNFKPSAMMDISDGLAGDLNHILKASHVGAELDEGAIPRNPGVSLKKALTDGEDYELLFTLSSAHSKRLMSWQEQRGVLYFYPIGTITNNPKQKIHAKSFTHF